jgi:hypothetical protein
MHRQDVIKLLSKKEIEEESKDCSSSEYEDEVE